MPGPSTTTPSRPFPLLALALIAAFSLLNLLTAERLPIVWLDEVMFADPAITYLQGFGFTTTSWPTQRAGETYGSNSPLYTILLIPWVDLFGVSPTGIRSINILFMALVALVGLRLVRAFTSWPWADAAWVILLYGGYGVSFAYRSGRYDIMLLLLFMLAAAACLVHHRLTRLALLFVICALVAPTGLHGLPLLVILAGLGFCWWRFRAIPEIAAAGFGSSLGLGIWLYWLHDHGLLDRLRAAVTRYSHVGSTSFAERLRGVKEALQIDPSSAWLTLVLIAAAAWLWRSHRAAARIALLSVVASLAIAVLMGFSGKLAIYYTWMKYVPLALGCCGVAGALAREPSTPQPAAAPSGAAKSGSGGSSITGRRLAWLVLLAALPAGGLLPARLANAARTWRDRDYASVANFVRAHVTRDDVVYTSPPAYYVLKPYARFTYVSEYLDLSPTELAGVSVLVLAGVEKDKWVERFGPGWEEIARMPGLETGRIPVGYDLYIYRRPAKASGTQPKSPASAPAAGS
ncbi:MAG: hypothetical protein AB7K52_04795 [Phycisphaerales bacterium]